MSSTCRPPGLRALRAVIACLLLIGAPTTRAIAQVEWLFPGTAVPTGWTPHPLVADVDGDGRMDIVSAGDAWVDSVGISLGRPDGTFGPIAEFLGSDGADLAADVTGDGLPDLVGSSELTNHDLQVLPGLGSGSFGASVPSILDLADLHTLQAGDLNLDGALDLVELPTYGGCKCARILLGHDDGSFDATAPVVPFGKSHTEIQLADFDLDGVLDIAGCVDDSVSGPQLWSCHGDGSGGFAPALPTDLPMPGFALAVADFDGDQDPDLFVAGTAGNGKAKGALLRNQGGLFHLLSTQMLTSTITGSVVAAVACTDFEDDGAIDVLVASSDVPQVVVLHGTGGFTFDDPVAYPADGDYVENPIGFADMDGDAILDAYFYRFFEGFWVTRGQPDGSFMVPTTVNLPQASEDVAIADCNGDGFLDVATLSVAPPSIALRAGHGDGSLDVSATVTPVPLGDEFILADVDGDDAVDVVAWSKGFQPGLVILGGLGNGGFGAPLVETAGPVADAVVGDFDADGLLDVVTSRPDLAGVEIRHGLGFGAFAAPQFTIVGEDIGGLAAGDIAAYGAPELVAARSDVRKLVVLDGLGGGPLQAKSELKNNIGPRAIAISDIEGDGDLDLTVACFSFEAFADGPLQVGGGGYIQWSTVETFIASSPGTFEQVTMSTGPIVADEIAVVDLDHDGHQDVIEAPAEHGSLPTWLFGQYPPTLGIGHRSTGPELDSNLLVHAGSEVSGLAIGDLDGDGESDVVTSHEFEPTLKVLINLRPTWSTLGHALPSSKGVPLLTGSGDPSAGEVVTVGTSLVSTPSAGALILGLTAEFTAFHSGVLVPAPTVAVTVPGNASFSQPWPTGIPAGTPIYLQAWFKSLLTGEISATNALVTIAQ